MTFLAVIIWRVRLESLTTLDNLLQKALRFDYNLSYYSSVTPVEEHPSKQNGLRYVKAGQRNINARI